MAAKHFSKPFLVLYILCLLFMVFSGWHMVGSKYSVQCKTQRMAERNCACPVDHFKAKYEFVDNFYEEGGR
ncbi:hypothetical protein RchiOBHm_Chr7g0211481 [Rosa chinensis]|uniref:Late nodulin n=1 Tax=Rosa chinensis TaxID=74649 RepID=A0A2P6PAH0_ROSCH|nr:hypothetical protein RchiOBHm_Chr7g0211481 [Rosa chinensis]